MSERGSPSDHTVTDTAQPVDGAQASAPPVDSAAPAGTDANLSADASSPSDTGAKKEPVKEPTLADVMRAAAELPDPQGASPSPAKDGTEKVEPAVAAETADEQDDSKLLFHNHPRWQEVNRQNREYREQVETLTPDAEQYRKINSFMEEHKLSPDEVGELFIVGAMAKAGDPRALQKIDDWRQKVALGVGELLPDDIKAKVETGEISESAGKELARARIVADHSERQLADREAADLNAQRTREADALRTAQQSAVGAWESEMRKKDPDYAKKENAVARYAKALIQDYGPPRTTKDAIELVTAAYAGVNKEIFNAMPKKAPVQRGPIASSSTGAKPQPKTFREALEQAAAM